MAVVGWGRNKGVVDCFETLATLVVVIFDLGEGQEHDATPIGSLAASIGLHFKVGA